MNVCQIGLIIAMVCSVILAQVKINGKIMDTTLVAELNPYIISENVIVPAGQKLVIKKGCILLFKPFTSISVEGSLIIQGEQEYPVIFTSEYDTKFNRESPQFPNAFDWNGIQISQNAKDVRLSNFTVAYSVYGIKSYKEDIVVDNGMFSNNGQSNLSINEIMKNVADGIPYSYQPESAINLNLVSPETDSQMNVSTVQLSSGKINKENEPVSMKKVAKMGCIAGGSVSLAATTYFYIQMVANQSKYLASIGVDDQNTYKARRNSSTTFARVSAVPTILFAGGAVFFYIVEKRVLNGKTVSVTPYFGGRNVFSVALGF